MIISEQRHRSQYRAYFHGKQKTDRGFFLSCGEFYLTTSFVYASTYALLDGTVTEYHLKHEVNIFNALADKDYNKLKNFCKKYASKYLGMLPTLKRDDWFGLFENNVNKRQELLTIIEELGFDGYFNFEIDKRLAREYDKRGGIIAPAIIESPSLAIFHPKDSLIKGHVYNGKEDFLKEASVQEARQKQIDYLAYKVLELYDKGLYDEDHLQRLLEKFINVLFFSEEELYEVFNRWNLRELYKDKEKFIKEFAFLKESAGYMLRPFFSDKKRAICLAEKQFNEKLIELYDI